jgi:hypothetical protein
MDIFRKVIVLRFQGGKCSFSQEHTRMQIIDSPLVGSAVSALGPT